MNPFKQHIVRLENTYKELKAGPQIALDLRYATPDNFMNENLYQGFSRCFLHPVAAQKFEKACELLKSQFPDLQFLIWDALRPQSVQKKMFEKLKDGPFEKYIARPVPGSMHNFGLAIDLTLQKKTGELLAMATDFDDFREIAQPEKEEKFLKSGELKKIEWENRLILRTVMEEAGFKVLKHEWWHFNALPSEEVHGHFEILD